MVDHFKGGGSFVNLNMLVFLCAEQMRTQLHRPAAL
jgi:hypothetical protein